MVDFIKPKILLVTYGEGKYVSLLHVSTVNRELKSVRYAIRHQ